jgi:hypothetical protein
MRNWIRKRIDKKHELQAMLAHIVYNYWALGHISWRKKHLKYFLALIWYNLYYNVAWLW